MCEHYCPICQDEWFHDIEEPCDSHYQKPCRKCEQERGDEYD
jgi:hypothetical protein